MQEYSSDIADCLSDAAETYHDGIRLHAIDDPEDDLGDGTDSEDDHEEGVGAYIWSVAKDCVLDRAIWGNFFAIHVDGLNKVIREDLISD